MEFHALYEGGREIFIEKEAGLARAQKGQHARRAICQYQRNDSAIPVWIVVPKGILPGCTGSRKDGPVAVVAVAGGGEFHRDSSMPNAAGRWRKDKASALLWGPRSGGTQGSTHGTYK